MGNPFYRTSLVIWRSSDQKNSTSSTQFLAENLQTLYDVVRSQHVSLTHEEAIGLWTSSNSTCSEICSSPIWKDSIPSLYFYAGFIASFEGWSDNTGNFALRALLDGATQYDFGRSGWPRTLSQISIDQDEMTKYSEFVEYVFTSMLNTLRLKYASS